MIDPAAGNQDFWWFPYADDEAFPGASPDRASSPN